MQEQQSSMSAKLDKLKWSFATLLLLAGFGANYYFLAIPLALRIAVWFLLSLIILAIASQTMQGQKAWTFFKAGLDEMRRVVWPSRQETVQTTLVVIAIVIVFGLVMWGMDAVLMLAVNWLTGQ